MARITLLFLLSAALAVPCAFGASAETASNKPSPSSNSKTSTSSNTSAPAQRINNVVNYNAVPVRSNPGPVNRVTPSGTRPMTPNAPARSGGLHTNPVPSPTSTSSNARYNSQKRNVNPTGDKSVAAGFGVHAGSIGV